MRLEIDLGKKYNERTLRRFRQFYNLFNKQKWSHYCELMVIKNINEMKYYIRIAETQNLSKRKLRERIKSREYERLDDKTKEKLINKEEINTGDLIKNSMLIKNKFDTNKISEKMLMSFILEDIPSFLKQLGEGLTFIENEYPIKIGDRYNYIDMFLYNIKDNCYAVI